ncbi:MAG: hypothetical protein V1830_00585 [Candidatus Omnitrophota bacterium]
MMSRKCKNILLVFLLAGLIGQNPLAWAEEVVTPEGLIVRPVVEYKSGKLRDPFKTYFIKEEIKEVLPESTDLSRPEFDLNKLKVQGIIWGAKIPQAIINDKVLTIGDLIEGAQIVSIEKKGITLSYYGAVFDLPAPR